MNAQTKTTTIHPVCPRCRSAETDILRNTELEENTNPDRYPEAFRLDPAEVSNFIVVPTIPPLRKSEIG